jgi:DNA-binding SARP family transcriptional activator
MFHIARAQSGGAAAPTREQLLAEADAARERGDHRLALRSYARIDPAASPGATSPVAPDVAWRVAMTYQERAEADEALEILGRARVEAASPGDRARVLAGQAVAHWRLGERWHARMRAEEAEAAATESEDAGALALAHLAQGLALSLDGEPAAVSEHYALGATYATRDGDRQLGARFDANRSHHLLADARYVEAAAVAERACEGARATGSAVVEAVALTNRAEALLRLGRLDEAVESCEAACALSARLGTARTAGALVVLAAVHQRRRAPEQARAALEHAASLSRRGPGDRQVRPIALGALATLLAVDEPALAAALAEEALEHASGSGVLPALLAVGRVASARGEIDTAREMAERALSQARRRRERAWLADALELRASLDPGTRGSADLREAYRIWHEADAQHDADRVVLRLAWANDSTARERTAARVAAARQTVERSTIGPQGRVTVRTFGRFEVLVDGDPVPPEAWQSKRARDLLRVLVARHGRAVPRSELCEAMWPDEDADTLAHRLSTLLSILRGILGAESVVADRESVMLDKAMVDVDAVDLLEAVSAAVRLHREGSPLLAREVLSSALPAHTDEPFADTPYDDQVRDLRDEVRAAYLSGLRLLAELCQASGDADEAITWLRSLLACDPYDEAAHLSLISLLRSCRRFGQARAAAARHREAMADLGVPPQRATVAERPPRIARPRLRTAPA